MRVMGCPSHFNTASQCKQATCKVYRPLCVLIHRSCAIADTGIAICPPMRVIGFPSHFNITLNTNKRPVRFTGRL